MKQKSCSKANLADQEPSFRCTGSACPYRKFLSESFVLLHPRVRLHSAIGYLTPLDKLEGREPEIFAELDHKLEQARRERQRRRQAAWQDTHTTGLPSTVPLH